MRFHTFNDVSPDPPLRSFVRSFRLVRIGASPDADGPAAYRIRIPPDGMGHVLIRLPDDGASSDGSSSPGRVAQDAPDLNVVGPRSASTAFMLVPDTLTIVVRLQPGALHALSNQPAEAFVDERPPRADVLPASMDPLCPRLRHTHTLADRLAIVRAACTLAFANASPPPPTVKAALQQFESGASPSVQAAADAVGVSTRHLRTLFQRHVGLAPKRFARIARLHRLVQSIRSRPTIDWAALAFDHGFYDQSHLVTECQAFLGETPSAFRARDRRLQP